MADDSRVMATTIIGAFIGGLAAFLFFTDRGRALRRRIEPALETAAREIEHLRGTVQKAVGVAHEGRRLFNDALGEGPRYPSVRQSSPF